MLLYYSNNLNYSPKYRIICRFKSYQNAYILYQVCHTRKLHQDNKDKLKTQSFQQLINKVKERKSYERKKEKDARIACRIELI
jgi:hypothetical protein